MLMRKLLMLLPVIAILFAACATDGDGAAGDDEFIVGISWNNYDQPRWACCDGPGIKRVVEAAGGRVIETVAANSNEIQLSDIDGLIAQGMDVLILLAKDPVAAKPAIDKVKGLGIPIIGYDRLVEDTGIFYITFDNQRVGTIMAEELTKVLTEGNIAIIKGEPADPNATFLRDGMTPILEQYPGLVIPAGCEDFNANWNTENARNTMDACLAATGNDIQGVLSENDSMATGVVAALADVGLAGTVPVTGQDGDFPALNRVALGTQLVSVWKDAGALGQVAGAVAVQLYNGTALADITVPSDVPSYAAPSASTAQVFRTPGGIDVYSITLSPVAITIANLDLPISTGWISKDAACAGDVDTALVSACA
ncbi:MAG TPA: substrate-binding domain-containing protein [Acidimicrobiia bacterium]|nr:substrate-binding domain-containing protein [Acidimicrobiia bacterium]